VCERLASMRADVLVAPPLAYGSSGEHAGFPGTLSIGQDALELLVVELGRSASETFDHLLLVSAHGGNAAAVALLGWSPLVALHYAGGGHSDAWMIALLLVGVAAPSAARGGAAWPIASAFKVVPAVLLPLELASRRLHKPKRWWLGLVGATVVVIVAATAIVGPRWVTATVAGAHQSSTIGGVHWLTELGLRHRYAVVVGALAFATVYLALMRSAWRSGRARLSLAATALCLTSSLLRPWYALWPLALAAVEEDELAGLAALALSAYLLFADAVSF